jgi:multidrug efflux pump subunit AcrB
VTATRVVALFASVVLAVALAVVGLRAIGGSFEPTEEQQRAFVESQARANCLVQRTVYPSREKLEAAYRAATLATGLEAATVRKLHDYENRNQELRVAIADRVRELCAA